MTVFYAYLCFATAGIITAMISWIVIDAQLNWNGDYKMSPAERGTRRCIKRNPHLERLFVEQGLL